MTTGNPALPAVVVTDGSAHGRAAPSDCPPTVTFCSDISSAVGWTRFVFSYVPGQLQFTGSPLLDVLRIKYWLLFCAFNMQVRSCAVARRGFSRNQGGSPVASARRPM